MELRHLRCFLAVADELHFGRAAQRLAISQPPLTVAIQQLEAEVGAALFQRNSRGVRLTAAGAALLPRARSLLMSAASAVSDARAAADGHVGRLVVGFAGTMLYRGLPAMLRNFRAAHPRIRLSLREMNSSEQVIELQHDRLDAGFVHISRVPAGMDQILVSSQAFVACVPQDHPLAGAASLAPAELAGEPLALVARAVSPDYHERIVAVCSAAGFDPEPTHELRHWLSVVSVVSQGLAVALVPAALQQSGMAGVRFVPLTDGEAGLTRYETRCLWNPAQDQPALRLFLRAVQAVADAG
ncbi:LysR family transcriptional regulator [Ottowia sp.]|uniref:LysR family transcriptional regulator n=1 Tax=Ottowia sp. TaxID=1898956 RepID=UPI003A83857D